MYALRKFQTGFTIVELLIVIVVIAILASISVTAYTGIQKRAETTARFAEVKQWENAFLVYLAHNGTWPPGIPPSGDPNASPAQPSVFYCLGKDFPNGNDGTPRCRDTGGTNSYPQSRSDALMTQLAAYTNISTSPRKAIADVTGPWATVYVEDSTLEINHVFPSGTTCPGEMDTIWSGTWTHCQVRHDP
jgi:prepilin-type N-terminal cleavage/methylation domain-containing protein